MSATVPSSHDAIEDAFNNQAFLPGLCLKQISSPLPAVNSVEGEVTLYVKKVNDQLKNALPSHGLSVLVTYNGGVQETEENAQGEANFQLVDEKNADGSEWDEKLEQQDNETHDDCFEDESEVYILVDGTPLGNTFSIYDVGTLKVHEHWMSREKKTLETIEVTVLIHKEKEIDIDLVGNEDLSYSIIGEKFVIDVHSQGGIDKIKNLAFEWDFTNPLMRQVSSPQDLLRFAKETTISKDLLYLADADNKDYDPMQPLKFHVNLNTENINDFTMTFYKGVDLEPTLWEGSNNTIVRAIEDSVKSENKLDLSPNVTLDGINKGWVVISFQELDILQAFLEGNGNSEELQKLQRLNQQDLKRILNSETNNWTDSDEKLRELAMDVIDSVRLVAIIESKSSQECIANFILDRIESNEMYFDSSVQWLNSRSSSTFIDTDITDWSLMATYSSLNSYNSIHHFASFKVKSTSAPSIKRKNNGLQSFNLELELPKDIGINLNDVYLLVENCDVFMTFESSTSPQCRFTCVQPKQTILSSTKKSKFGRNLMHFEWDAHYLGNLNSHEAQVNITALARSSIQGATFEGAEDADKKIGTTSSFSCMVGSDSNVHNIQLNLIRNTVGNGVAKLTPLEESVALFLDSLFSLVLKCTNLDRELTRTQAKNAANTIADSLFAEVMVQEKMQVYLNIMQGDIFSTEVEDVNLLDVETLGGELKIILGTVQVNHEETFSMIVETVVEETPAFTEEYVHDQFRNIFEMSKPDLASAALRYPTELNTFIRAGRRIYIEVSEEDQRTKSSLEDIFAEFTASGLSMERSTFEDRIHSLTSQVEEVEESVEGLNDMEIDTSPSLGTMSLPERQEDEKSILSRMESNFTSIIDDSVIGCEGTISAIESAQDIMYLLSSQLDLISGFKDNFNNLHRQAQKIAFSVESFNKIAQKLGGRCPLWPVKAICLLINNPTKFLIKALKRGRDSIKRLNNRIRANSFLKQVNTMKTRCENLKDKFDKPTSAVEKFREILMQILAIAKSGLIPISLISSFASSTTLKDFFTTLKNSMSTLKQIFKNALDQVNILKPLVDKIQNLCNSVSQKFRILDPINNLFRKLTPHVDKAIHWLNKNIPWWLKWTLKQAMRIIEFAIDLLLRPFKNVIKRTIERINPFNHINLGPIDEVMNKLPSFSSISSQFNIVDSLVGSSYFQKIINPLTHCAVIVLRALFAVFSQGLAVASNRFEHFENALIGSEVYKRLEYILKERKNEDLSLSISDLILEIKEKSVDETLLRCDSYLRLRTGGQSFFNDNYDNKIFSYISSGTNAYELLPCHIDVAEDMTSHFFFRGHGISWLNAPIASLMFHSNILQKAATAGFIQKDQVFDLTFVPEVSKAGSCTIMLHSRLNEGSVPCEVDLRLPVKKTSFSKPAKIEELTGKIIDHAKNLILAPTHNSFSSGKVGSGTFAMIEKAVICCLDMSKNRSHSIGTGVHLLSGITNCVRYKKQTSGAWTKQDIESYTRSGRTDEINGHNFTNSSISIDADELTTIIRERILSISQVEVLSQIQTDQEGITDTRKEDISNAIASLSIFFVRMSPSQIVRPIMCHDDTSNQNILYSNGRNLQPLKNDDIMNCDEIWEYPMFGTAPSSTSNLKMVNSPSNSSSPTSLSTSSFLQVSSVEASTLSTMSALPSIQPTSALTCQTAFDSLLTPLLKELKNALLEGENNSSAGFLLSKKDNIEQNDIVQIKSGHGQPILKKYKFAVVHEVQKTRTTLANGKKKLVYILALDCFEELNLINMGKNRYRRIEYNKKYIVHVPEKDLRISQVLRYRGIFNNNVPTKKSNPQGNINGGCKKENVQYWALEFGQLKQYVKYCKEKHPELWQNGIAKVAERGVKGQSYLDVNEFCEIFIIPHTTGTGMGVALNMQTKNEFSALYKVTKQRAEVLISHAWSEDIEQVIDMLDDYRKKGPKLRGEDKYFTDKTVLWFCPLALFQVNKFDWKKKKQHRDDILGPLCDQQVTVEGKASFELILETAKDMFAIQTTTCDPFSRLWCVFELDVAWKKEVSVHALFSKKFYLRYVYGEKMDQWGKEGREIKDGEEEMWVENRNRELMNDFFAQNPIEDREDFILKVESGDIESVKLLHSKPLLSRFDKLKMNQSLADIYVLVQSGQNKEINKEEQEKLQDLMTKVKEAALNNSEEPPNERPLDAYLKDGGKLVWPYLKYIIRTNIRDTDVVATKVWLDIGKRGGDSIEEDHKHWYKLQEKVWEFYGKIQEEIP